MIDEADLIKACISNDTKAQRTLYEKYHSRMYSLCLRYSNTQISAEDLLQEGFIVIFSKLRSYTGNGSFEGWMRKIFVNTALMQLRKSDVMKDAADIDLHTGSASFDEDLLEKIDGKQIFSLIMSMPHGFRVVFNMFVFEGFSHQEIAKELNITEVTSRSQLNRARNWLQKRIINLEKEIR